MKETTNNLIRKMCLAAMFLALAYLLPLVTMQIQEIGNMLTPMHIPIILAGFILGPYYGLVLGFIAPLTRSLMFGMPPIYPTALCMSFELATYGFISGLFFKYIFKNKTLITNIYLSLIIAMIFGRFIWGIARLLCGLIDANMFTFSLFISGAFITAWPGIIIQLILIPLIMYALYKTNLLKRFY